jgi:glucose/arabinose dehydrogenase
MVTSAAESAAAEAGPPAAGAESTAAEAGPPAAGTESPAAEAGPPAIHLEPVVDGLDRPLDIAVRPAFPDDIVVAEQAGRLRLVRDGGLVHDPLLDIADAVSAGGERGLLGVAPHPDPADDRVFVYYTASDGRQLVASFATDPAAPGRLRRDSEVVLLAMDDEFGNHNGGGLAFGPDGYLYIATGDGGGAGDPLGSGRDLGSLLGKILRIDVDVVADAEPAYGIPADNPFVDLADARDEVWHTGLRNPFRFRFDGATGDMWIGDVGQNAWEEVDLAPAGTGGLDFGWNLQEGSHCFAADPCDEPGLASPVAEYGHDRGCTVIGGTVYRGSAQPSLEGWYVFADHCSGLVFALDAEASLTAVSEGRVLGPTVVLESGRSISAIAPGPARELYATDLDAGELLHVVAAD